ncbi:hypothetical protein V8C42DRAFT_317429 [Trichoderma barbatum]
MDSRLISIESTIPKPKPYLTASSEMAVLTPQARTFSHGPEYYRDWDRLPARAEMSPARTETQSLSLPPLRQIFPELNSSFKDVDAKSQTNGSSIPFISPDYYPSPNKRRRAEDDAEAEAAQKRFVPRVLRGPRQRVPSSPRQSPSAPRSSDRWASATATTVSPDSQFALPTPMEVSELSRPQLPSLRTTINFENESRSNPRDYGRAYSQDYTHYNTHSHYQSQPSSPGRPFDRTAFSAGAYHNPHYMETSHTNHYGELGAMVGESKQRKRRGNLPKETTDKLRTWFVSHLQHPYPSEDEKQELVRQTGLQMNQISNWFINARRRQLPAMLNANNAQADAANAGRGISSREGKSIDPSSVASSPISEAEAAHSSDEILQRRRRGSLKRGSV